MRILIYGAGAVGCYLGWHLASGGNTVTLLGREPIVDAIRKNGLFLQTHQGGRRLDTLNALSDPNLALSQEYDWIAFTMKAYATVSAIYELQTYLPDPPPIVCFQNGVGNEESLRSAFGADRVVAATMTTPVSMPQPGVVMEERPRGIAIALDVPPASMVEAAFQTTKLVVRRVDNTPVLKWSKLLLNMLGNATSAILDMLPGEIFKSPSLFKVEWDALKEAVTMMRLQGLEPVNLPGVPARLLAHASDWIHPAVLRPLLQRQIASGRGHKAPSLLAALRAGAHQTEVAWLNGAVVQAADRLKRLAPVNHALALIVSDIASGRTPWDMYRRRPEMLLTAVRAAQ
jgi:2-dehydropantoate 2-reductase